MDDRKCFMDGVVCSNKTVLVQRGSTCYCVSCFVAAKMRARGEFPHLIKPGMRKLVAPGTRWRGTHVAPN